MEFSRLEYWSGQPFPSPGDLPNPGTEPWFPALQADSLLFELQGSPGPVVKNLPANVGDIRDGISIPESGRSPGEGNGYPLQDSCLENSMDRGAWQAIVHGVAKSQTSLSN